MNFQNIPRRNKLIKRCFIPKLDAFASWDYEQIEYRLLAYYLAEACGDTSMADTFRQGLDPHTATGELILGRTGLSDNERQIGKTLNFSIIYSGGVPTILRQMAQNGIECNPTTARKWLNELRLKMPGIKTLNEQIMEEIQAKGYIFDIFGRHYHPDPTIPWHDAVRKLLNALIQGCAAGLTRSALVQVAKQANVENLQSHLVNVVHDEMLMDCVNEEIPLLAEKMPIWMGNETIEEVVPITVEMSIGPNWADKEVYV